MKPSLPGFQVGLIVLLLAASLVAVMAPASAAFSNRTREEPMTGQWLWMNVTWSAGQGQLVVGDPPSGAEPPEPGQASVQFSTPSLPHAIYLDPSRLARLDVALTSTGTNCGAMTGSTARVKTEVLLDSTLVSGAVFPPYFAPRPQPQPGMGLCSYRMPLEASYIPAGSRLTLRIDFEGQAPGRVASSTESPTSLVLPTFSPEEAIYRMPEFIPRPRDAPGTGDAAVEMVRHAGWVALLPVALLVHGGRPAAPSRRAIAIAALLLALSLAGCMSGPRPSGTIEPSPTGDVGNSNVTFEDPWDPSLADESTGSIVGRVIDRYGYPIGAAHVAILSRPESAQTSSTGVFSFKGIAPGRYTLRVDRENYATLETAVQVQGNKVSRVDVTLAYDDSLAAGDRPHIHDYWIGETTAVLFEGPAFWNCGSDPRCKLHSSFYLEPVECGDRRLIRPGTSQVEITLTFDAAQACATKVGVAVQDNTDPNPDNWSFLPPRSSGVPFHMRTTWENADVGHQLFSSWTFAIYLDSLAKAECSRESGAAFANDAISNAQGIAQVAIQNVQIKIHKGALPLEPRHPDPWEGKNSIALLSGYAHDDPYIGYPDFATIFYALCLASENTGSAGASHVMLNGLNTIVGAGAKEIRLSMNQSRSNGVATAAPIWDWQLWYKAGDTQVETYYPGTSAYRRAPDPTVSDTGRTYEWVIPVEPSEADGFYSKKSAWRFVLAPDDPEARCTDMYLNSMLVPVDGGAAAIGPLRKSFDMTVWRDV